MSPKTDISPSPCLSCSADLARKDDERHLGWDVVKLFFWGGDSRECRRLCRCRRQQPCSFHSRRRSSVKCEASVDRRTTGTPSNSTQLSSTRLGSFVWLNHFLLYLWTIKKSFVETFGPCLQASERHVLLKLFFLKAQKYPLIASDRTRQLAVCSLRIKMAESSRVEPSRVKNIFEEDNCTRLLDRSPERDKKK